MKPGGGKHKGAQFERQGCQLFSLWVSAGEHKDLFWRSAMSGGRATIHRGMVRQAGDMCAVAAEGHPFTDRYYVEFKHVKDFQFFSFAVTGEGKLAEFWRTTVREAHAYLRQPLLVAKQNNRPTLLITDRRSSEHRLFRMFAPYANNAYVYLLQEVLEARYGPKHFGNGRSATKARTATDRPRLAVGAK